MTDADDALLRAAQAVDVTAVTTALQNGANVNARDDRMFGRTALMTVSMHSSVPLIKALLAARADVNPQSDLGETALILAATSLGGESIRVLLAHGADPTIADRDQKTALMWMVDMQEHRGQDVTESIGPLIDGGVPVNAQDKKGRTALMWAVQGWEPFDVRSTVLGALVDNGADVNATDHNGETAMFGLVRYIDNQMMEFDACLPWIHVLVNAGADPNAHNNAGTTPLGLLPASAPAFDFLKSVGFTE